MSINDRECSSWQTRIVVLFDSSFFKRHYHFLKLGIPEIPSVDFDSQVVIDLIHLQRLPEHFVSLKVATVKFHDALAKDSKVVVEFERIGPSDVSSLVAGIEGIVVEVEGEGKALQEEIHPRAKFHDGLDVPRSRNIVTDDRLAPLFLLLSKYLFDVQVVLDFRGDLFHFMEVVHLFVEHVVMEGVDGFVAERSIELIQLFIYFR